MPRFDTDNFTVLCETMKRYLDAFADDCVCPLQIWYEALGGCGVPTPADLKAMEKALGGFADWESVGEIRYEKFGRQPSYKRAPDSCRKKRSFASLGMMAHHLFKPNGLYRGPDGKLLKVVLSEVYNLRCFEIVDGNMTGPMIKIHPTSDYAKQMAEV